MLPSPFFALGFAQMSRVAAARTIPVTNAAWQENSSISLKILVICSPPLRPPSVEDAPHP
jgi:hypothetical protein